MYDVCCMMYIVYRIDAQYGEKEQRNENRDVECECECESESVEEERRRWSGRKRVEGSESQLTLDSRKDEVLDDDVQRVCSVYPMYTENEAMEEVNEAGARGDSQEHTH